MQSVASLSIFLQVGGWKDDFESHPKATAALEAWIEKNSSGLNIPIPYKQ